MMTRSAQLLGTAFVLAATVVAPACGEVGAGGLSPAEARVANEDLDLEGEPCERLDDEPTYRICDGGEGVQFCGRDSWGWCQPSDGCMEGAQMQTPVIEWDPCSGITGTCIAYEDVTRWEFPECGTPLVLRFDDAPVRYHAFTGDEAVAAFSIDDSTCTSTDWPTAQTPWLALDLDGDGEIRGGDELFGSGTRLDDGRRATHGFEALAQYDANGDGQIDAADPVFSELLLWADHDADRRSSRDELSRLADAGLQSISVDFRVDLGCDARGNCGKERADFVFDGAMERRVGEVVDVYLPCR